jgi:hypothetical protein
MITRDQAEVAAKKLRQELPEGYEVKVEELSSGHFLIYGGVPADGTPMGVRMNTYFGTASLPSRTDVLSVVAGGGRKSTDNFYQAVDWIIETVNSIKRNKT